MNKQDPIIENFFTEMKEADRQIPTPEFHNLYRKKLGAQRKLVIFSSVAASLLIFLSIYITQNKQQEIQSDIEFEVLFLETENESTQTLLRDTESIYSWAPTSNSLLNNFNE